MTLSSILKNVLSRHLCFFQHVVVASIVTSNIFQNPASYKTGWKYNKLTMLPWNSQHESFVPACLHMATTSSHNWLSLNSLLLLHPGEGGGQKKEICWKYTGLGGARNLCCCAKQSDSESRHFKPRTSSSASSEHSETWERELNSRASII